MPVQLPACPECRSEFAYEAGALDEIADRAAPGA